MQASEVAMSRFRFPRSCCVLALILIVGHRFFTPAVADSANVQGRHFEKLIVAQEELCLLSVDDFNIGEHQGTDSLTPRSRTFVKRFTEEQATKFWSGANGNYQVHYRSTGDSAPNQAMQRLQAVITNKLCAATVIQEMLISATTDNSMQQAGAVYGGPDPVMVLLAVR